MSDRWKGMPIIPIPDGRPDGPPIIEGTVRTPAGDYDLCPSCGVARPIDGRGRFKPHPPSKPEGGDRDGECWTVGQTRIDAELAEAMSAGTAWEHLG